MEGSQDQPKSNLFARMLERFRKKPPQSVNPTNPRSPEDEKFLDEVNILPRTKIVPFPTDRNKTHLPDHNPNPPPVTPIRKGVDI